MSKRIPVIKNKIYTGIGSRETPRSIMRVMYKFGYALGKMGCLLRSGGAIGADSAFELGCVAVNGPKAIYLPRVGFQKKYPNSQEGYYLYNESLDTELRKLVEEFHPSSKYLEEWGWKFMMRNCHQVLGFNLDEPTDFILMYSSKVKYDSEGLIYDCKGGTGFAVRLAYAYKIPVFLLNDDYFQFKQPLSTEVLNDR